MLKENVKIFKALSDPNRLRILKMLQNRTLCVCEIREIIKLANSTVSKHLSILKNAGFIVEIKDGKWVNYSINNKSSNQCCASIISLINYWTNEDEQIKKDFALTEKVDRKFICCK